MIKFFAQFAQTTPERSAIFISYSHKDEKWLKRLQVHLKDLERRGLIALWDDTKIRPGDEEKDGVKILPLIISQCLFDKLESLSRFRPVNPLSKPMNGLPEVESESFLVKLNEEILSEIRESSKKSDETKQHESRCSFNSEDESEGTAPDRGVTTTGLEKQEEVSQGRQSKPLFHKLKAISLVFLLFVFVGVVFYEARRRDKAAVNTPAPIKFPLTSTDVKDTYKPIVNIAFWKYRLDFGDVDSLDESSNRNLIWTGEGVSRKRDVVDQAFGKLEQSGIEAVVWFLFADGTAAPDFDKNGFVTGLDQSFVNDYKVAIELAKKNRISIIWVLIDNLWMKPKKVEDDGAVLYGHADVIEDPPKRRSFFEKALKPLLQMYPTQSPIAGWIVVNEPEVALEQGYILEENLNRFIRETAQIIRETAPNQPVSVGHLDLESLIKYHRDHKDTEFDFYVFHHYKTYMPPSVVQIKQTMGDTSNRPLYIGEFNLNEPTKPRPVDRDRFVNWSRALGYAGVWPWALKPVEGEPEKFQDIADISRLIKMVQQQPHAFDDIERSMWQKHAERGIETVNQDVRRWRNEVLVEHSNQIVMNRKNRDLTVKRLAQEQFKRANEEQILAQANQVNVQNHNALKECQEDQKKPHSSEVLERLRSKEFNLRNIIYGRGGSEEWVKSATENWEKTKLEIKKQEGWLLDYERKIRLNEYQSKMKEFRIQLAQPLYLNYWREEIRKVASSNR